MLLSFSDWRYLDKKSVTRPDYIKIELQELLDGVLKLGRLNHLEIDFISDDIFPKLSADADLKTLTSLKFSRCDGNLYDSAQTWLQTLEQHVHLEALDMDNRGYSGPRIFELPKNTLKLKWMNLYSVSVSVVSALSFPNLQSLSLTFCEIDGWKTLCNGLVSLKHLKLFWVNLEGIAARDVLSSFPEHVLGSLETCNIKSDDEVSQPSALWLEDYSMRLPNLRELEVFSISVPTLNRVLANSSNLEKFSYIASREESGYCPEDEHLVAFSLHTLPSLKSLTLLEGDFSEIALDSFLASFPLSIRNLTLHCEGMISPKLLRSYFRLSLWRLDLGHMLCKSDKHEKEIKFIAREEKPEKLKLFQLKTTNVGVHENVSGRLSRQLHQLQFEHEWSDIAASDPQDI